MAAIKELWKRFVTYWKKQWLLYRMTHPDYLHQITHSPTIDPSKGLDGLPEGPFRTMAYTRMEEAEKGPYKIIVDGDSRMHFGEGMIEKTPVSPPVHVMAIGGDTTETALIRLPYNAMKAKPVLYINDDCGNDALGWAPLHDITQNLFRIFALMLANGVARIGWVTPCATGNPDLAPPGIYRGLAEANKDRFAYANALFPQIIEAVQNSDFCRNGLVQIIDIRPVLMGSDGYMKDKYCAPDRIHHLPAAYLDAYVPGFTDFINRNHTFLER